MDTKLKKISYSTWVKAIAFVLVITSFALSYSLFVNMLVSTNGANALFEKDYMSSRDCINQTRALYSSIENVFEWKNEEYIANECGRDEYEKQVADRLRELELAESFLGSMSGIYYYASDGENVFTNCEMTTASEFRKFDLYNIVNGYNGESSMSFYVNSYIQQDERTKVFIALDAKAEEDANEMYACLNTLITLKNEEHIKNSCLIERNNQIQSCIRRFTEAQSYLKNIKGIYYYAAQDETVLTNCSFTTAEEFRNFKYYNIFEGYATDFKVGYNADAYSAAGRNVFIAFQDDYMAEGEAEFERTKTALQQAIQKILLLLTIGLLMLVYLIFVCGRDTGKNMKMLIVDRLWTELTLGALMVVVAGFAAIAIDTMGSADSIFSEIQLVVIVMAALIFAAMLMFFLSLVRHIKNRTLIKHSLTYIICRKAGGVFKALFSLTPLKFKLVGSIISTAFIAFVLTAIGCGMNNSEFAFIFFLITIAITAGIVYVVIRFVIKPYDDEVNSRLSISLDKAMKAERLKTDLITNVSHDLKTPLTAILNYSDLLIKENESNEYAKIIFEKSQKLKNLTEDLFEVSKAQSGNILVNTEKLNISELIAQTLAEIDENKIDFKLNIEEKLIINADGRLMSRVFENLCGNIIKYSLDNTRAYIDAFKKENNICIVFKNIASYEMNFRASEMSERFSRGDASRTTEGNGLGLAIAKSYTEACGGRLNINVDGDLFKVTLTF